MRKFRKFKKIFTQGWILLKFIFFKVYCAFHKKEYKNCWIISEHGNDARDNGYYLFKYLRENHSNIDVRYIITKDSPDLDKIKKLGKYIIFGSKEHYKAYITTPIIISTHLSGCSPDTGLFFRLQKYGMLKLKGKLICIKHGITKDYLPFFNPKDTNLSLLVTAAKKEYDYFIDKNGYSPNVVKLTGFARFDSLIKKETNQILFMPTFRKYMHYMNDNEFIKSDYFKHINGLINNDSLITMLEKKKTSMIFYIHSEFYKYIHLFKTRSSRIIIAHIEEYDIQDLLINSSLLITDYSSVFFDFAYMKKPIIYYQFDYDTYRKEHYREGYFNYANDGFGPVCYKEEDFIKKISKFINNKYKVDKNYLTKMNDFFAFNDKNNCKRIYNEIMRIYEEQ